MRFTVVVALLSMTQAIRVRDDFLVEAPTVAEFLDTQGDVNVLDNDKLAEIPDNLQVTYPQAMHYIQNHESEEVNSDQEKDDELAETESDKFNIG